MSFRLVPKSVTLNDLESKMAHTMRFSPNSAAFGTHDVKAVEDIPEL